MIRAARSAGYYCTLAAARSLSFAYTGTWDIPLCYDGVHFTEEGHRRFAEHARQIFAEAFET
nr:hypothetical protein [uncultured Agathobaculum sp.]